MKKTTVSKKPSIPTGDKVRRVASWLMDKKAKDIVGLDVSRVCTVTEAMIVATAANVRQAQALADHVLEKCSEERIPFLGMDGYKSGQWVLVDLNDVIVHIFMDEARHFYNIEGLWAEGVDIPLPEAPTSAGEAKP